MTLKKGLGISLLRCTALMWILLVPLTVFGADDGKFTDEERTRFRDVPNKFPRHVLPPFRPAFPHGKVYWIDSDRLIMTVRELPSGWKASATESSKIVIINANTGEVESTPYRGDLECYSPERMLIRSYQEGTTAWSESGPPSQGSVILAGKLGEQLAPIQWKKGESLVDVGCQLIDRCAAGGYESYPLPAWNSVLRVSMPYNPPPKDGVILHVGYGEKVRLEDSKGQLIAEMGGSFNTAPAALGFYFLPFRNQYFVQNAMAASISFAGRLYNADGSHVNLEGPLMLLRLGSGLPWVMTAGILWEFTAMGSGWPKQGLYWQDGDRPMVHDGDIIYRVDNATVDSMAVSPDGCKIFYQRFPGQPWVPKAPWKKNHETVVMNVCQGK